MRRVNFVLRPGADIDLLAPVGSGWVHPQRRRRLGGTSVRHGRISDLYPDEPLGGTTGSVVQQRRSLVRLDPYHQTEPIAVFRHRHSLFRSDVLESEPVPHPRSTQLWHDRRGVTVLHRGQTVDLSGDEWCIGVVLLNGRLSAPTVLVDGHVGFAVAHEGMSNAFAAAGCDLVERHPVEPNRVSPRGHRGVFARTRLADQRNVDVQGDLTTDERWNGDEV